LTPQVRASVPVWWKMFFFSTELHAAPWQLYTPSTPVNLFMFHILSKLRQGCQAITALSEHMFPTTSAPMNRSELQKIGIELT